MSAVEEQLTVAGKVAHMNGREFADWVDSRLRAQKEILETVTEQVGNGIIEPLVGARIASCVTGSVFGYEEFHPRAGGPPAEQMLETTLLARTGPQGL